MTDSFRSESAKDSNAAIKVALRHTLVWAVSFHFIRIIHKIYVFVNIKIYVLIYFLHKKQAPLKRSLGVPLLGSVPEHKRHNKCMHIPCEYLYFTQSARHAK